MSGLNITLTQFDVYGNIDDWLITMAFALLYIYLEDYMSFHFLILFKIIFVLKKYDIFLVFFNDFNVLI